MKNKKTSLYLQQHKLPNCNKMKTNEITPRTAARYWDLVKSNDDEPKEQNLSATDEEYDDELEWWEEEMLKQPAPPPYTIEELHERIARSQADIAAGRMMDFDDAMREIEAELEEELEMAEAV